MKIFFESFPITFHRIRKIVHRRGGEVATEHRTTTIKLNWHSGRGGGFPHPVFKLSAELFEPSVSVSGCEFFQRCDARRHRYRVAAEGAGLVNRAERRQA